MSVENRVFTVNHVRELEDGVEEVKFIGVFSNQKLAQSAIDAVKKQPGFRDFPEGFLLEEHILDKFGWKKGFSWGESE